MDWLKDLSIRGTPIYLEWRVHLWKPNVLVIFLWMAIWVLKKNNLDFSRLMEVPKASENPVRISLKELDSLTVGMPISRASSMNCWWVEGGTLSWSLRHVKELFIFASLVDLLSPSTIITKRKGDSGSSCIMPMEGQKGFDWEPLRRIEKKAHETFSIIHFMQSLLNPKTSSTPFI